jgi:glycosyltransferase involved in cell wall biosynthesis
MTPCVSVICVCHQHDRFIREALQSVLDQTYPHVELIVVDDGSTDGSVEVIADFLQAYPHTQLIKNDRPKGYCCAFNAGWRLATGDWVIDLAGDDVLLPERIERGVTVFQTNGQTGIQFSDAIYIDESGTTLSKHSDRFPHAQVPQGFVFNDVLRRYFICSPTMMISRQVLIELNGYDETLSYEDFDLWIRAAKKFPFHYVPEVLVKKRVLANSLSQRQFRGEPAHNQTTFRVCEKALKLAISTEEKMAVRYRILYELYQRAKQGQILWVMRYAILWLRSWR